MKKLILALSFVFALGLVSVNAQAPKKVIKKEPVKTEQTTTKPAAKPAVKPATKHAVRHAGNKAKETPAAVKK